MRVVRFRQETRSRWGLAEDERIIPLAAPPWETDGIPRPDGAAIERRSVSLLAPVSPSAKILCIGRNYHAHAQELGNEVPKEPLVFFKPTSSLLGHGGAIVLPEGALRVDYEGELALVVGRRVRKASPAQAREALFGLTCAIDVSGRDWQKKDGQWWRAKGCDTFCPVGPAVVVGVDPGDLLLETLVNGVVKQSARTSEMAYDAATLLSFISKFLTLEPGDLILTGTPEGVAPLASGQQVEVRIEKVGSLVVRVA